VLAARRGDVTIIELLLKAGAGVDAQGPAGWTALMQAAGNGHAEAVSALLAARADPTMRNTVGRTARDLARRAGHDAIERPLPE
jgi:uncharacterized protein